MLACFAFSYSLGQAIGSLAVPPFSEAMGRKPYYIASCIAFSITYVISGITHSLAAVFIGRFVGGLASAVPSVVVAGTVEDLYDEEQRVWFVWIWNCFTILSQVLGPVYGSWVAQSLGWQWVYYIPAIVTAAMLPLFLTMPETRHVVVLRHFVKRLSDAHSSAKLSDYTVHDTDADLSFSAILGRPARLLFTEPLVFVVTVLCSFAMGLIYLFTEALGVVYTSPGFSFSYAVASLPFLAMVLGVFFSILPRFIDIKRYRAAAANPSASRAELKLTGFAFGSPALAIGLWVFSWTIPPLVHVHWLASMVGLALIGFAATEISYTLQGYLADVYTVYACSALSGLACVRALVSGVMPLFARQMFNGLGNNAAGSLLAGLATLFLAAPIVFLRYGPELRRRSPFARIEAAALAQLSQKGVTEDAQRDGQAAV